MYASGSMISMPVMKIDHDSGGNDQSKQEKKKQIERQLPRMLIADKQVSEKILANAMRPEIEKNTNKPPSIFPQPSAKLKESGQHSLRPSSAVQKEHAGDIAPGLAERKKEKSLKSEDFHALEEYLLSRNNPLDSSEILSILKNMMNRPYEHQAVESAGIEGENSREDIACSLDFIEGYVFGSDTLKSAHSDFAEIIESLRQKIMGHMFEPGSYAVLQEQGCSQLLSNSGIFFSLQQNVSGHQRLVVEGRDRPTAEGPSSDSPLESDQSKPSQEAKPEDDSLPLIVQRSV